jgi:hypothetical protein
VSFLSIPIHTTYDAPTHTQAHSHMHLSNPIHPSTLISTRIHICTCAHIHLHTHACTHARAHARTHARTHAHTQT